MKIFFRLLDGLLLFGAVNYMWLSQVTGLWIISLPLIILFLLINVIPSPLNFKTGSFRLHMCADGSDLLFSFLISATLSVGLYVATAFWYFPVAWWLWAINVIVAIILLSVVFWNGIIRVYCSSLQLGIKHRVIGLLCGWIPIANLWALCSIICIVSKEVKFESAKIEFDKSRQNEQVCATKYPVLLVHGVFFRDFKYLNYWGRIPEELKKNGAVVFYGNHQSALSVADSAVELAERIKYIVSTTGCEKVNIIAHSKGGLDCRYAISNCGIAQNVASLTTINTPHKGCLFADYLLEKMPVGTQNGIAKAYNGALKKMGDSSPDFIAAVKDLTANSCNRLNSQITDCSSIFSQSVGSKLNHASNGKFPLNFSYHLVKYFDGANDGLVSENSFEWGQKFTFLTVDGKRGISHGDMIDLNRENIKGFDVREFYVQLVADLKNRGL